MSEDTEVIDGDLTSAEQDTDAQDAPPQQDDGPSVEDRALMMGWTPKDQFKGDPEKWVDAETFVKRGEEFLPFLKANNRRLEQALERESAKRASLEKAVSKAIEHVSKAEAKAYERAMRDIQARLDEAAAAGDVQGVREATDELVELAAEAKAEAKPAKDAAPEPNPDFEAWREENEWYGRDKALSAAFDALCKEVYEEGYTKPKAGLKEAMSRLKDEFPHKFTKPENPNRRQPAAVEGSGSTIRPRGKTYGDLPPEAKAMCDELCRDIKGFTREKYVREFFAAEDKK